MAEEHLIAYLDESGIHSQARVVAVAGFIAPSEQWNIFVPQWMACLRKRGVGQVRAANLESGHGSFAGWPLDARAELRSELISTVLKNAILGFGSAVVIDDFEHVGGGVLKKILGAPYFLACQSAIIEATYRADLFLGAQGPIRFIFEQQPELAGRVAKIYQAMRSERGLPHWHRLGPLEFRTKAEAPALQAADLLVYESYKEIDNRHYNPTLPMRRSLQRLLSWGQQGGKYFDRAGLTALLQELRNGGRLPPDYVLHDLGDESVAGNSGKGSHE